MLEVLKDRRIKMLSFGLSVYRFEPHHYHALARAIGEGKVDVACDGTLTDTAAQSAVTNTLYFGFSEATDLDRKSVIVHESTHAICDMRNLRFMGHVEAEGAAYIAQFMFVGATLSPTQRVSVSFRPGGANNAGSISNAAWRIAHANLVWNESGVVARNYGGSKDYTDLEKALRDSSLYAEKIRDNVVVGYDGVRGLRRPGPVGAGPGRRSRIPVQLALS